MPAPTEIAPSSGTAPSQPLTRVPASALVAIGRKASPPGAITVRVPRAMPLRHGLMLALALAVMALGAVSAHKRPIYRAIIVLPPALQGAVVT